MAETQAAETMFSRIPAYPLAEDIAVFWYNAGFEPISRFERILPTGTIELVLDLDRSFVQLYNPNRDRRLARYSRHILCGPQSRYFMMDTHSIGPSVGIHFKPGGLSPYISVPVSELHNQLVDADDLWGLDTQIPREKLLAAETPSAMFACLEAFLLMRRLSGRPSHPVVVLAKEVYRQVEPPSLKAFAASVGLSQKRLIDLFRREVGMTPKRFHRLMRFQTSLRVLAGPQKQDLAETALISGYYDQAHFNQDFKAFSGLTPRLFLEEQARTANHLPTEAPDFLPLELQDSH